MEPEHRTEESKAKRAVVGVRVRVCWGLLNAWWGVLVEGGDTPLTSEAMNIHDTLALRFSIIYLLITL